MSAYTVTVARDPESPQWWLASFAYGDGTHTTQGATIEEARYMAADLLALLGAEPDALLTFVLDDRETLGALLAQPAPVPS